MELGFGLSFNGVPCNLEQKIDEDAQRVIELLINRVDALADFLKTFEAPADGIEAGHSILRAVEMAANEFICLLERLKNPEQINVENAEFISALALVLAGSIRSCTDTYPLTINEKQENKGEN